MAAAIQTLQRVDGAMAFGHLGCDKTGFLEMAIHIAGEDKAAARHALRKLAQYGKALMWRGTAVQLQRRWP
jgi:hypothetical protein